MAAELAHPTRRQPRPVVSVKLGFRVLKLDGAHGRDVLLALTQRSRRDDPDREDGCECDGDKSGYPTARRAVRRRLDPIHRFWL